MSTQNPQEIVRIDLTQRQQEHVKERTGRTADAIELTVEELEARIAPKLVANHNETLLRDSAR
jgi:hypothetical protein